MLNYRNIRSHWLVKPEIKLTEKVFLNMKPLKSHLEDKRNFPENKVQPYSQEYRKAQGLAYHKYTQYYGNQENVFDINDKCTPTYRMKRYKHSNQRPKNSINRRDNKVIINFACKYLQRKVRKQKSLSQQHLPCISSIKAIGVPQPKIKSKSVMSFHGVQKLHTRSQNTTIQ